MSDSYYVLDKSGQAETRVKGSRFVAGAFSVSSVQEADAALAAARKADYDATHHCTAYRIGPEGHTFRYSDDGEPNGSAGLPIFRQIEGRELTDTMIIVVRFYGGTKLGTGGLVRAYGEAASLALDAATVREVIPRTRITIRFAYDDTSPAMHTIGQFDVLIADTAYSEETQLTLEVRTSELDVFLASFTEALSGRGFASGTAE